MKVRVSKRLDLAMKCYFSRNLLRVEIEPAWEGAEGVEEGVNRKGLNTFHFLNRWVITYQRNVRTVCCLYAVCCLDENQVQIPKDTS